MRTSTSLALGAIFGALVPLILTPGAAVATVLFGPIPYLDASNSPFDRTAPGFVLEDFEDGTLGPAGVSASAGAPLAPGTDTDSVDADDGSIDGFGRDGHSFFSPDGPAGITFTFDPVVLGGVPREVGIVWTDGEGEVAFEAFDAEGNSLGGVGPVAPGDGRSDGATPEDRFFGVAHEGGISAIHIANDAGGIEVDHLQFGAFNLPPDCTQAVATPATFWPPNHGFAAVHVVGVTDPDGDPVTITVTGVGQDEPVGAADGDATCPDAAIGVGGSSVRIRVERAGRGDGRVYAIDFRAEDGRGGACEGLVTACVPHDQGHGDLCGDQGAVADSTGLACMTACEGDECVPAECDGADVPRGVIHRTSRAGRLLDVAARRGRRAPARRAVAILGKVERKVAKLAGREMLPGECAEALADRVATTARRARRWLARAS
jgi:hypothetical protein